MKTALVLTLFFIFSTAQAFDHTLSTQTNFAVTSNEASLKLENSLLETEGILKHFAPAGVTVIKKVVYGNAFEFLVEKNILGMSKRFDIKGTLSFERIVSGCSSTEDGYLGVAEFSASEPAVTTTIESFSFLFCSSEKSIKSLNVRATNTLYYKGKKFNFIVEKVAKSVIEDQVAAVIAAVKADISTKK